MTSCQQLALCLKHAATCETCQAQLRQFNSGLLGKRSAAKMSKADRVKRAKLGNASRSAGRCSNCRKPGHYRKNCPLLAKPAKPAKSAKPTKKS